MTDLFENEKEYSERTTAGTYLLYQEVTAETDGSYKNPAIGDMVASGTGWLKLCDLKDCPSPISAPEPIDDTTLSDFNDVFIKGKPKAEQVQYKARFTRAEMKRLKELQAKGVLAFEILLGRYKKDAYFGSQRFCAEMFVRLSDFEVNGLREAEITLYIRNTVEEDYNEVSE